MADGGLQTCILRVSLTINDDSECDRCRRKLKKKILAVGGVKSVDIDMTQHKATVIGKVDAAILIQKLTKSGKIKAELWPQPKPQPSATINHTSAAAAPSLAMINYAPPPPPHGGLQTCILRVSTTSRCECDGCRRKIKKKLSRVPGVKNVDVDMAQHKATVTGKDDDADILIQKLTESSKIKAELWPQPKPKPTTTKTATADEKINHPSVAAVPSLTMINFAPAPPPHPEVPPPPFNHHHEMFSDKNRNGCFIM